MNFQLGYRLFYHLHMGILSVFSHTCTVALFVSVDNVASYIRYYGYNGKHYKYYCWSWYFMRDHMNIIACSITLVLFSDKISITDDELWLSVLNVIFHTFNVGVHVTFQSTANQTPSIIDQKVKSRTWSSSKYFII